MKQALLAIFSFVAVAAAAQKKPELHTPAELVKIMTDSKVTYNLSQLDSVIKQPDRSAKVNYNDVYRKTTATGTATYRYSVNKEAAKEMEKAEEEFAKNNLDEARKHYLLCLEADTGYYMAMTYIGQTYYIQKNWNKAIEWYEKATRVNYIDYMAHWFLADTYSAAGKKDEALDEILIAHVLNRNNPRIMKSLDLILGEHRFKYNNWVFSPQYSVKKNPDNSVELKYGEGWLVYAVTKAIWNFEPGYRESMGYSDENVFRELEEKEGLIGLLLSEDPKTAALVERKALEKATDDKKNNMLQEYIFYEILLTDHPSVAYQLPEGFIQSIADYVLKVRCERK